MQQNFYSSGDHNNPTNEAREVKRILVRSFYRCNAIFLYEHNSIVPVNS